MSKNSIMFRYAKNKEVMINLWDQIAEIADFDKVTIN